MIVDRHSCGGRFAIGSGCYVKNSVNIDITDDVTIVNDVIISDEVLILTHDHDVEGDRLNIIHSPLIIKSNVFIGVRATILNSCNYIGCNSVIGACTVVTKDVPDNVIYAGNPGKIIRKLK